MSPMLAKGMPLAVETMMCLPLDFSVVHERESPARGNITHTMYAKRGSMYGTVGRDGLLRKGCRVDILSRG